MKRILSIIMCVFLVSLCGCGEKKIPELDESETPPISASYKTMKLGADGVLDISRKDVGNTPMGEAGTWTIFVYMSGSNLETIQSSGTKDLNEMCAATAIDNKNETDGNVRFVVQTGGAEYWRNDDVGSEKLQRHVISNGKLETVTQMPLASMGEAASLRNFVKWGVENYPAEKMGLVLWGHGKGSLGGVCKDDLFDGDYLTLSEINSALSEASEIMTDKFEFMGFDACYMGTLETADVCASYARYMIGSEELEPAEGWNYTALGELLRTEPNADWDKISETICESFLTASEESEYAKRVTLSVIDLSEIDNLLVKLNDYSRELCENCVTREQLVQFKKTLETGEHFGNGTIYDGYSNSADLLDFIKAGAGSANAAEIEKALEGAIIRKSNGSGHPNASGLTIYFPFEPFGTENLRVIAGISPCPYYIEFIDAMLLSASPAFDFTKQNAGQVAALCVGETGENSPLCERWRDLGKDAMGGNLSALVKTSGDFSIASDGKYNFSITPETLRFAKSVGVNVFWRLEYSDAGYFTSLGTMTCPDSDWESGDFSGTVNVMWIMLPNHEPLAVRPYEITESGVTYVSNIRLGKEEKGVTISADNVGKVSLDGYWEYGENGRYTLEAIPDGSTCIPFRYSHSHGGAAETYSLGNKMVFDGAARVTYDKLDNGDYYCFLEITDVYGDTVRSPIRDFTIANGKILFK